MTLGCVGPERFSCGAALASFLPHVAPKHPLQVYELRLLGGEARAGTNSIAVDRTKQLELRIRKYE